MQIISTYYSSHSNWKTNPHRFENLVKGIAKCPPLRKSMRILELTDWGLSKEEAQAIIDKYELEDIEIEF